MESRVPLRSSISLCVIFSLGILFTSTIVSGQQNEPGFRLDVFRKISNVENADHSRALTVEGFQNFVDTLMGQIICKNDGDHEGHDHGDHEGHDHGDHEGHDHEDIECNMFMVSWLFNY